MSKLPKFLCAALLLALSSQLFTAPALAQTMDCSQITTNKIPLPEMLPEAEYCRDGICTPGGLYPGGFPNRPPDWNTKAQTEASKIQPLLPNGSPPLDPNDPSAKIVVMSIGMSNTVIMYHGHGLHADNSPYLHIPFMDRVYADPAKNPQVEVVNGAKGGIGAEQGWADPDPNGPNYQKYLAAWNTGLDELAAQGLTPAQVQVVWVKHAQHPVDGDFPRRAEELQGYLEEIIRQIKLHYPNVKLVFNSSRTYSYAAPNQIHREPDTYEGGLATRWMIEKQMNGDPSLNWNPDMGEVKAPLLLWGPYLWTDGLQARSDGLIWECGPDGDMNLEVHPTDQGAQKNADQLFAFFKTDPLSTQWYLKPLGSNPPIVTASANVTSGSAPLTVNFTATASDPGGSIIEYVWTYGDGTFSYNNSGQVAGSPLNSFYAKQNPIKTFTVPGIYHAYLTVTDDVGNAVQRMITITVTGSTPPPTGGPTPTPNTTPGDTDGDNDVDIFDYSSILSQFGQTSPPAGGLTADVDPYPSGDNDVDIFDFNLVITNFTP